MNIIEYLITFADGSTMYCYTNTKEKAKILAQAERIRQGRSYKIAKIEEVG